MQGRSADVLRSHCGPAADTSYQKALLEYHTVFKSDAAAAAAARQKAVAAFQYLQKGFQREIEIVKSSMRRSKSLALTRDSRGLNIARNNRRIAKLRISDEVEATRLVCFGRYGRYPGNGLAVIDFGSRVSHVHDSCKAGGDWYREMFIESTSIAASATIGTIAANVGASALGLIAVAAPVGWWV
jgi:hypothetical protein